MNELHTAAGCYRQEVAEQQALLAKLQKEQTLIGWLRLIIILITATAAFYGFTLSLLAGWISIVAGSILFLIALNRDTLNNAKIVSAKNLIQINEEELKVQDGNYRHRYDGSDYEPALHDYATDLDIFGKASLYQYINRCNSESGRTLLAHNFLQPLSVQNILERHEAITELSPQYSWRQQFQSLSAQTPVLLSTQQKAERWLAEEETHFTHPAWKIIMPLYSLLTIASAIATVLGFIPGSLFSLLFLTYLITAGSLGKKAAGAYADLNGIVSEIDTLQQSLQWIEEKKFASILLNRLQQSVNINNEPAYKEIKRLKSILTLFDLRLNLFLYTVLNSFLLWDVRQMMALNRWRQKNRSMVSNWYTVFAEVEVVNSLATLRFNEPSWCWPTFSDGYFTFTATAIGHPLIPTFQRVTSDFSVAGSAKIALITGSNMAGKSTFLRSLGVATVLAQMGAPVCAGSLVLSPADLMSSMRIADNLAENTSTFYAELKKLKTIIKAVRQHRPVFILLDEILRGTNSLDRHTGSKALIRQLIKEGAVAVIATHDIELSKLQHDFTGAIYNYHFDVQVDGEELYFDYLLKDGVCTSLNASILMAKIGIELE